MFAPNGGGSTHIVPHGRARINVGHGSFTMAFASAPTIIITEWCGRRRPRSGNHARAAVEQKRVFQTPRGESNISDAAFCAQLGECAASIHRS
jgi:hypothetical protein